MKVFCFLLSYLACFSIVLLVASAIDTMGREILPILGRIGSIALALVFVISSLSTYLAVLAYTWLVSVTPLHLSCAMLTMTVITKYRSDSERFRTAQALALLGGEKMPDLRLDAAIARANAIGHTSGFAIAALAYLRSSAIFLRLLKNKPLWNIRCE